ncbi:hypothetical protein J6590_065514 [Homalodisca vitripennis]|nr:hypothetical protein J6590_065514 [Homalodisca vitripennis]
MAILTCSIAVHSNHRHPSLDQELGVCQGEIINVYLSKLDVSCRLGLLASHRQPSIDQELGVCQGEVINVYLSKLHVSCRLVLLGSHRQPLPRPGTGRSASSPATANHSLDQELGVCQGEIINVYLSKLDARPPCQPPPTLPRSGTGRLPRRGSSSSEATANHSLDQELGVCQGEIINVYLSKLDVSCRLGLLASHRQPPPRPGTGRLPSSCIATDTNRLNDRQAREKERRRSLKPTNR